MSLSLLRPHKEGGNRQSYCVLRTFLHFQIGVAECHINTSVNRSVLQLFGLIYEETLHWSDTKILNC